MWQIYLKKYQQNVSNTMRLLADLLCVTLFFHNKEQLPKFCDVFMLEQSKVI